MRKLYFENAFIRRFIPVTRSRRYYLISQVEFFILSRDQNMVNEGKKNNNKCPTLERFFIYLDLFDTCVEVFDFNITTKERTITYTK